MTVNCYHSMIYTTDHRRVKLCLPVTVKASVDMSGIYSSTVPYFQEICKHIYERCAFRYCLIVKSCKFIAAKCPWECTRGSVRTRKLVWLRSCSENNSLRVHCAVTQYGGRSGTSPVESHPARRSSSTQSIHQDPSGTVMWGNEEETLLLDSAQGRSLRRRQVQESRRSIAGSGTNFVHIKELPHIDALKCSILMIYNKTVLNRCTPIIQTTIPLKMWL